MPRRPALLAIAGLALVVGAVWSVELITSGPQHEGAHDRGGVVRQLLLGSRTETQAEVERAHDLLNTAIWGDASLAEVQPEACRATRRAVEAAPVEADELPEGADDDLVSVARIVCADLERIEAHTRHEALERVELRIARR